MAQRTRLILTLAFGSLTLALTAQAGSDDTWTWRSTQDAAGGPYAWPTPANFGATDLALGTGDSAVVSLPFSFPFYGSTYSQVTVTSSGLVLLSGSASTRGSSCVADGSSSAVFIAPWWRDWDLDSGGTVYARAVDDGLFVQWDSVIAAGDTETVSFGAVLYATGEVQLVYKDANTGLSTTRRGRDGAIGLQTSTEGVSFGCDSQVLEKAASYALWFTPRGLRTLADDVSLTKHADLNLLGEASGDEAGAALAFAEDADGDGLTDIVVGAPGADTAYGVSGGSANGSLSLGAADWTATGSAGSRLGAAVDAGGDVDGDGLTDTLLGAPADNDGGTEAGAAWLVLGGASGGVSSGDVAVYVGADAGDAAGTSVAIVGDTDGDGYEDLLIGGPGVDSSDAGVAWLVLGSASPTGGDLGSADTRITGIKTGDHAGQAVSRLGDPDGDGLADFAIGAPGGDSADTNGGTVYVVSASALGAGAWSLSGAVDIYGVGSAAGYGSTLAANGDLSGDGLLDVLTGGPNYSSGAGSLVYIKAKSSSSSWPARTSAADGLVTGSSTETLGSALTALDLGDDSLADVAVGSPEYSGSSTGRVWIIDTRDLSATGASASSTAHGWIDAPASGASFGQALASADFDGDGYTDLLVGAPGADGDATGSGAVWLLLGEPTYTDDDGDGYLSQDWGGLDCNDNNTKINPGRGEKCDGVDNNCTGQADETFTDTDGDLTADCVDTEECDTLDNDGDGGIDEGFPDTDGDGQCDGVEAEACDGLDNDGDSNVDEGFGDGDNDGLADCLDTEECDGLDNDGDSNFDEGYTDTDKDGTADCVDREGCDELDNDGDGNIDEGFPDTDGDGDPDCVDAETCDGLDNNGDGDIDEGLADADEDGLCDELDAEDCDGLDNDGDRRVDEDFSDSDNDGRADCLDGEDCDGVDNNGDGSVDEGWPDSDLDGTADCEDKESCDGLDNDGDTYVDEGMSDTDYDGSCDALDSEGCDGLDNDGDGTVDEGSPDVDGDRAADCIDVEECDGVDNDGDAAVDEAFADTDADGVPDCLDEAGALPSAGVISGGGGYSPWGCATAPDPGWVAVLLGLLGLRRRSSKRDA